jgi:hypothetical protein
LQKIGLVIPTFAKKDAQIESTLTIFDTFMVSTKEIAQQTKKLEITLDYKRRRKENVQ